MKKPFVSSQPFFAETTGDGITNHRNMPPLPKGGKELPILGNSRGDTKRGRGDVRTVPLSSAFLDTFIVLQKWIPCHCTACIPCYYTVHIIRLREADSLPYGFYRWVGALFNEAEETTEPSPRIRKSPPCLKGEKNCRFYANEKAPLA